MVVWNKYPEFDFTLAFGEYMILKEAEYEIVNTNEFLEQIIEDLQLVENICGGVKIYAIVRACLMSSIQGCR